jgi:hypothetical protein
MTIHFPIILHHYRHPNPLPIPMWQYPWFTLDFSPQEFSCSKKLKFPEKKPVILWGNDLRDKIVNIENYMDFLISMLVRLFFHYPYAVHA